MLVDKQSELMSDLLFTVHQQGGDDVTWKPPIVTKKSEERKKEWKKKKKGKKSDCGRLDAGEWSRLASLVLWNFSRGVVSFADSGPSGCRRRLLAVRSEDDGSEVAICKCKCKCKCRDWEDKHTCPLYIALLACLTRIYGPSEVNTAFREKREASGGGEKIKRRFISFLLP